MGQVQRGDRSGNVRALRCIGDRPGFDAPVHGQDVTDRFQIRPPVLVGLNAVDGSGVLGPDASGSATWIIVPTEDAAPLTATNYYVGGTLSFNEGGQLVTIELQPVQIRVEPDAALHLKYFLQRDVYSDDPFTEDVVEPAQPFVLGMLLENHGWGTARNLRITSGQPQIVEKEQGLLIDFDLIATQVDDQNLTPSFTASFGNVLPGERRVAQWLMVSTLQGQFTEYEASFEHLDGLGDPRVSLIKSAEVFQLIRSVLATDPGADTLPDFLTNEWEDPDFQALPDTLHLSDGRVETVTWMTEAAFDAVPTVENLQVTLTVDPSQVSGFRYLRADDPSDGLFRLVRVQRSDGVDLPVQNFWQTDRTFADPDKRPILENKLHLFDFDGTGSYTLYYESGDVESP